MCIRDRYSVFKELFLTALGGTIMNEFEMGRKVRCHMGLWKTLGSAERWANFVDIRFHRT